MLDTRRAVKTFSNYIDGAWIQSSDGGTYEITDPGDTEHVVGRFPLSKVVDVDRAVRSARKAFRGWRSQPAPERAEYVYRFMEACARRRSELAEAITVEMGKPIRESYSEIDRALGEMRFVAGEALRFGGRTLPSARENLSIQTLREPLGVVAAITPWNFPAISPLRKVIPALVYGCTVVLKPASPTPLSAVIIAEMLEEAGLPAGVFNLVLGKGGDVGDSLVTHPDVDGITFTGSTEVGTGIAARAAANNTRVQLEMGGKNACVVVGCSNVRSAASQIVSAAFTTSGQRCTSISRVIVLEAERAEIEATLVEAAAKLRVGHGREESTTMGPLVSRDQMERSIGYIEAAQRDGARVLAGGNRLSGGRFDRGYYLEPTLLTDVRPGTASAVDEIFGPVLSVVPVSSFPEALEVANEVRYGLASSIFTDSMSWAHKFVAGAISGMVHVNNGTVSEPHVPFGGVKQSGMGAYSIGATNEEFFTNLKVVYYQH